MPFSIIKKFREKRFKRNIIFLLSWLTVAAFILPGFFFFSCQRCQASEKEITAEISTDLLEEYGRHELLNKNYAKALVYLSQSYGINNFASGKLSFLLGQAVDNLFESDPASVFAQETWVKDLFKSAGSRSVTENKLLADGYDPTEKLVFDTFGRPLYSLIGHNRMLAKSRSKSETAGHSVQIQSAVFSPNGKFILTTGDSSFILWDADNGKLLHKKYNWVEPEDVKEIHYNASAAYCTTGIFSTDGGEIFTADSVGIIRRWDSETMELISMMHNSVKDPEPFKFLKIYDGLEYCSNGGTSLLVSTGDHEIIIWDVNKRKMIAAMDSYYRDSISLSPDCSMISFTNNDNILVFDIAAMMIEYNVLIDCYRLRYEEDHDDDPYCDEYLRNIWRRHGGSTDIVIDKDRLQAKLEYEIKDDDKLLAMKFGHDNHLLCLFDSGRWAVFDTTSGEMVRSFPDIEQFQQSAFLKSMPIELIKTYYQQEKVKNRDTISGNIRPFIFKNMGKFPSAVFSQDGEKIVTVRENNSDFIDIWNVDTQELLFTIESHNQDVSLAVFDPSGKYIASIGKDKSLRIWDTCNRNLVYHHTFPRELRNILFSNDGKFCVILGDYNIDFLPKLFMDFEQPAGIPLVQSCLEMGGFPVMSRDGSAIASVEQNNWGSVIIVNLLSKSPSDTISLFPGDFDGMRGKTEVVTSSPSFHPDGKHFITGMGNGAIYLWKTDEDSNTPVATFSDSLTAQWVIMAEYNNDGTKILSVDSEKIAKIWDTNGEKLFSIGDSANPVTYAAFSPDGALIATTNGNGGQIDIFDSKNGLQLQSFKAKGAKVEQLMFSPDGNKLAAILASNGIQLFNTSYCQLSSQEIEQLINCYVPWKFSQGKLLSAFPDPGLCTQ